MSYPVEWTNIDLGILIELQNGFAFKSVSYQSEGDFVIRIGNVQDGYVSLNNPAYVDSDKLGAQRFRLTNDDLLISLTGNVGRVAKIKKEQLPAVLNQRVARAIPSQFISRQWVYYLLRSCYVQSEVQAAAKGAAQLNISTKDLIAIKCYMASYAEQKVIAEKLDTLLAQAEVTKARLESTLETLKQFRQSVLETAMKGHLIDRKEPTLKHVNELVSEPLKNGKSVKDGDGPRVLRLTALKNQVVDLGEFKNGMWTVVLASKFFVQEGDILVSRGNGSLNLLARGSVVKDVKIDTAYPDTMIRIRLDKNKISSSFFLLAWSSQVVREQIQLSAKTTAGIWKISQKDLSTISVPYFSISEQTEIVRRVEKLFASADATEQQVNQALERVNNLTQSILAKAFRGELTEQWRKENPELISDENSAEALLKKIKAERAVDKPKRKTRKISA